MPVLVLLRHGQSVWNLENRFTGWVDVDLSENGVREAHDGGRRMREAGFAIDVAFTSVLKRAIRTLWIALDELDQMWVPVHRDWRLNERHYGALQGLDKAETARRHGDEQVRIWRRSYATRPPALPETEALALRDRRYAEIPPQSMPRCESLSDTLARVLPCWESALAPTLREARTVLVAAHGNSLRALIKHLEHISDEDIVSLEIPTGVPIVYDLDDSLAPRAKRSLDTG